MRVQIRISSVYLPAIGNYFFRGIEQENIYFISAPDSILPIEPQKGQCWIISGTSKRVKSIRNDYTFYETHIKASKATCVLPDNGDSFIKFLSDEPSFSGIGIALASKIWKQFGSNIFSILEKKDIKSLEMVQGLNSTIASTLCQAYEKYVNLKYSHQLSKWDIPLNIQLRLIKYHNEKVIAELNKNPYKVLYFGMKFYDVDQMAKKHFKVNDSDPRRLVAAINESLIHWSKSGHTASPVNKIRLQLKQFLLTDDLIDSAIKIPSRDYIYYKKKITSFGMAVMARTVALRFHKLANHYDQGGDLELNALKQSLHYLPFPLTDQQKTAVEISIKKHISYISGGAGTGKTTVVNAVIRSYTALGYHVSPIALSGKAAMQLHKSTDHITYTIASFLNQPPLSSHSLVIIDEASMIDLPTMFKIVNHIHPNTRILFVGDGAQLPPIGPGSIFIDLIKSNITQGMQLNIIQRQQVSSGIPEYSKSIRNRMVPRNLSNRSIFFHEAEKTKVLIKSCELYQNNPQHSLIVAYRNSTVNQINAFCQDQLNPTSPNLSYNINNHLSHTDLKLNDPILICKNNYKLNIQNGSLGKLTAINGSSSSIGELTMNYGPKLNLTPSMLEYIKLAYAITLHKVQGSQMERIIIIVEDIGNLLDSSWLYTAITRGEKEVHIVGNKHTFKAAIQRLGSQYQRHTLLVHMLKELQNTPLTENDFQYI